MSFRIRTIMVATALAGVCAAIPGASLPPLHQVGQDLSYKMHGDLEQVLAAAGPDELIPVKAIMSAQVPMEQIREIIDTIKVRDTRYEVTKGLLKPLAERTQQPLLQMLADEQAAGNVGERIRTLWISNIVAADVTAEVAYRMAARNDVGLLAHNPRVKVFPDPIENGSSDDILDVAIECGVQLMGAPRVWNELGITGRGAIVAMIDTGTCPTHSDIANQIWTNPGEIPGNGKDDDNNGFIDDTWGWNFDAGNNNPTDTFGHGSHTSGTVGGDGTGGTTTGMAPDVSVMILKVGISFSDEMDVWNAMQYASDNRAHTFSMSLGWPHSRNPVRKTWRDICINGNAMGTAGVIASGNEGCGNPPDNVRTPGDVPEIITVGATDCNDNIASFSSCGPVTWENVDPYNDWPHPPGKLKPTISAPGVLTTSHNVCNGYTQMSGTSMATPHVAGVYALMAEANPGILPEDAKRILIETSIDLGAEGWDNTFGAGRVDAFEAVKNVSGVRFEFPNGLPEKFSPAQKTVVRVETVGVNVEPKPGSGKMHYTTDGENFTTLDMVVVEKNVYDAVFPKIECRNMVGFYFSAEDTDGKEYKDPGAGADSPYVRESLLEIATIFDDDFEAERGWTIENKNVSEGGWERVVPQANGDRSPEEDFDGSGKCYVTGAAKDVDLDGGPTRIISKPLDLSNGLFTISYAYWLVGSADDTLKVHVSSDGGQTWILVIAHERSDGWETNEFDPADYVELNDHFRLRFAARDLKADSTVEAGIDAVKIVGTRCEGACDACDTNCDGSVDLTDVEPFIGLLLGGGEEPCSPCAGDTSGDGSVDLTDVEAFIGCLLG